MRQRQERLERHEGTLHNAKQRKETSQYPVPSLQMGLQLPPHAEKTEFLGFSSALFACKLAPTIVADLFPRALSMETINLFSLV